MAYFTINRQVYPIDKQSVSIGRVKTSDIIVSELKASRNHAKLTLAGDAQYILTDLGSQNGTYVNGVRIKGDYPLSPRDVVMIGNATMQFFLGSPEHMESEFPTVSVISNGLSATA